MPKIFISYRRNDSTATTLKLYNILRKQYGDGEVLFDKETLPLGQDFAGYIEKSIRQCEVFLIMIGNNWLNAKNNHGLRLLQNEDYVRLEIEFALKHEIYTIPIFTDGIQPLTPSKIPSELLSLAFMQRLLKLNSVQLCKSVDLISEQELFKLKKEINQRVTPLLFPDAKEQAQLIFEHFNDDDDLVYGVDSIDYTGYVIVSKPPAPNGGISLSFIPNQGRLSPRISLSHNIQEVFRALPYEDFSNPPEFINLKY